MPKNRPIQQYPIFLQGAKIPAVAAHKFLGIMLNQELRWKEQMSHALSKGTKWVTQYCRLAKLMSGVSTKHMRCFYTSVAIPKMLYTTDLFLVWESQA